MSAAASTDDSELFKVQHNCPCRTGKYMFTIRYVDEVHTAIDIMHETKLSPSQLGYPFVLRTSYRTNTFSLYIDHVQSINNQCVQYLSKPSKPISATFEDFPAAQQVHYSTQIVQHTIMSAKSYRVRSFQLASEGLQLLADKAELCKISCLT